MKSAYALPMFSIGYNVGVPICLVVARRDLMMAQESIDVLFNVMKTEAESASLLFVSGVPNLEANWLWNGESGNVKEFILIATHAKADIIYFDVEIFDLEAVVNVQIMGSDLVSEYDDDYEADILPIVQNALSKFHHWVEHDGQSARLVLTFIANGVSHMFVQTADWFDRFQENMGQHINALEQTSGEQEESKKQENDTTKKLRAEELARSDRYAKAKNDGQRRYIAEEMFSDIDSHYDLNQVLEFAALIFWDKIEPERDRALAEEIVTLRAEGMNQSQISAHLGVSRDKVGRLLASADKQQ